MLALLQPLAMVLGCLVGWFSPAAAGVAGKLVDPLILLLVLSLFACLPRRPRDDASPAAHRPRPRIMLIAWVGNFVLIPIVAALASLALWRAEADIRLGVAIYMLSPCTDWFLGYTRLARGDTATGAALIPINMVTQLLLYPVWLFLFGGLSVGTILGEILPTLGEWFVLPAVIGLGLRLIPGVGRVADRLVPWILAALVCCVIAANAEIILQHPALFGLVLGVVFCFFVLMYQLGKASFRALRVDYPAEALLTMTTSARNAPLMLGLTTALLPDRPLAHAALILGMLVEFPHLAVITRLLLRRRPGSEARSAAENLPRGGISAAQAPR
ncbi:symporter [Corynebacterium uropygiale]|uniref:Symporter n=1 Tax=Corynebacterium uropygiale TaxID=1775911 RepID=A0A9X1TYD4_9CORY|nr:symporter [Corynebacterium uropygiale]